MLVDRVGRVTVQNVLIKIVFGNDKLRFLGSVSTERYVLYAFECCTTILVAYGI